MKKFLAIMLSLAMLLSLTACGADEGGSGKLNFTTGGDQGTYYGFGTVLAGVISDKTKTQVTAITSGGSQALFYKINTFGEEAFLKKLEVLL